MVSRTDLRSTPPASAPALAALDALLAELGRIDMRLRQQVDRLRSDAPALDDDQFRGLYISDAEVDAILDGQWPLAPSEIGGLNGHGPAADLPADASVTYPPLRALAERFDLDHFDIEALLICLAPEISLSYERLYAYLQDDVTRKRPSVDLVLTLLCSSLRHKLLAWRRFSPTAPLLAHELLIADEDQANRHPPRLATFLKVDERVVEFLLGPPGLDRRLAPFTTLTDPTAATTALLLPDDIPARLEVLAAAALADGVGGPVICLEGPEGVGRHTAAVAICGRLGVPLVTVDMANLLAAHPDDAPAMLRRVGREMRLLGAALYCDHTDALLRDDRSVTSARQTFTELLATLPGLCLLAMTQDAPHLDLSVRRPLVPITFPKLNHLARFGLWRQHVPDHIPDGDLDELSGRFYLNAAQIRAAASRASNMALGQDPADGEVALADIYAASRRQGTPHLGTLARKITPRYRWGDIILPPDPRSQLAEMIAQMRYRGRVLEHWGFDRAFARGKGLNALFSGPSGTGKTMAAEIMAGELGIELYKVDLSSMVSKYIGETEKNLEQLFSEAEHSSAILFFDEADAIFGKRSEVKDAHDRYANIEVGYLLQRIEEYDGVVILATNLRKNMDDAFVRRLHMSIEFPFPEEPDRLAIWRLAFPQEAPLDGDVDLPFMARRFKLTGGNIKNIALTAAFLAAADGDAIHMAHVIRGTRREYQKLGKLVVESEFGPYMPLLKQ
jgi:SpoVK/Ycf46/Vps4 family AAA+-type ATPase